MATYNERKIIIKANEKRCTSNTKKEYEAECIVAYQNFNNCFPGRVEETSPRTTSSTTPGHEPTTTTETTTTERNESNTTKNSDEDN